MPTAPSHHKPGRSGLPRIDVALADKRRPNANARGYTYAWSLASKRWLDEHPLCVECMRRLLTVAATVVDHIIPHRGNRRLFWDRTNWQSLCETCHNKKTGGGQ